MGPGSRVLLGFHGCRPAGCHSCAAALLLGPMCHGSGPCVCLELSLPGGSLYEDTAPGAALAHPQCGSGGRDGQCVSEVPCALLTSPQMHCPPTEADAAGCFDDSVPR